MTVQANSNLITLIFKPTLKCTANCYGCASRRSLHRNAAKEKWLCLDDWKQIIQEGLELGLKKLEISGGEPTLYKDLIELISYAKQFGLRVQVNTNGSMLTHDLCEKLLAAGLDSIMLSLYSHEPDVHNSIRRSNNLWNKAVQGALYLRELQAKYTNFRFVTQAVLCRENFRTLDELFKLHYSIGADRMIVSYMEGDFEGNYLLTKDEILEFRRETIPRLINACSVLDPTLQKKAITSICNLYGENTGAIDNLAQGVYWKSGCCNIPSTSALILANGDVHPCNIVEYTHDAVMGNLFDSSFTNIWSSANYDKFRHQLHRLCHKCPMNIHTAITLRTPDYYLNNFVKNELSKSSKLSNNHTAHNPSSLKDIYNNDFYIEQKDTSYKSAEVIVPIILDVFNPASVVDVGCGVGGWLHVFNKSGVADIYGYDVSELEPDKYYIDKNLIKTNSDFTSPTFNIDKKPDVLTCIEVAEHLPDEAADRFVSTLTSASSVIIFSAAFPGQTGVNHINEQPPWYWREKFNKAGYFEVDFIRPQIWCNENIKWTRRQNITCFVKPDVLSENPKLASLAKVYGQKQSEHKLTIVNEWILKRILNGKYIAGEPSPKIPKPKAFISVIIPTCNRAALLYNALESITRQTYPQQGFEVIVVDNGSTDSTPDVCKHFANRIKNFKYIYDPRPGLHIGRHTGYENSSGDILVYADDDIEAFPTWLEGHAESFADPYVAMVGGKNLPKFESTPPDWVAELRNKTSRGWWIGSYSIQDFGDELHETPHELIWGCNFGIRKEVLRKAGGFNPDSLPQELIKYRGDGETALSLAVRNLGLKAIYNPKASIHHFVSNERLTPEYIYRRAFNQGVSNSYTSIRKTCALSGLKACPVASNTIRYVRERGLVDGFSFHQQAVQADRKLLEWVLRKDYFGDNGVLPQ